MDNFERTKQLIGLNNFNKITNTHIAVIGLGGVGGTALEALTRTGFKKFTLVDFDKVDITNLNRQILYTVKSINKPKVKEASKRIKEINPEVEIASINAKLDNKILEQIKHVDFIVDAIDDIKAKILLIKFAKENNIPFISSLGMANRFDSSRISIMKLNKTTNDPLARKLRYELKNLGIDTKDIVCAFSQEEPLKIGSTLASIMMPPSSAGLAIAGYVLKYFMVK